MGKIRKRKNTDYWIEVSFRKNYLTEKKLSSISARTSWRPQHVKVGQEASLMRKSTFGFLQGSVQRSLLFNVNDWQKFVQSGMTILLITPNLLRKCLLMTIPQANRTVSYVDKSMRGNIIKRCVDKSQAIFFANTLPNCLNFRKHNKLTPPNVKKFG